MKYSTPFSQWIRAISIDTVLTGGYALSLYFGETTVQSIYIFLFWWLLSVSTIGMLFLSYMTCTAKVDNKIKEKTDLIWTDKLIDRLAYSHTFAVYHWLTDLVLICLLVAAGHPVLASIRVINFFLGLVAIDEARARKAEQLIPTQEH